MSPINKNATAGSSSSKASSEANHSPPSPPKNGDGDGDRDESSQRVGLACFYCRAKRIRCSGTKPICAACTKTGAECEWPAGRRRKRTRKEMEEARRAEAEGGPPASGNTATGTGIGAGSTSGMSAPMSLGMGEMDAGVEQWTNLPGNSNFVWPPGFLPDPAAYSFDNSGALGALSGSAPDFGSLGPALAGFLTDHSPGTDARLIQALESQTAYISGDPTGDDDLELYYYRFSGSTALQPGINRISLKLHRRPGAGAPEPETDDEVSPNPPGAVVKPRTPRQQPNPADLFDPSGLPHRHVWDPIFERFLKNMSQHFPSVSRKRMTERYDSGTMSAFLANCICALGARFGEDGPGSTASDNLQACAPFVAKAQELVVPLLHLPAHDVCTGLLMLAWASYGQNSDSGQWQYTGMAIRMAIDLGLHENSEIYESTAHVVRTRLLFWCLFVTDRVVAFATGRPASIPEDIIEIPLPEDADFFPDPTRDVPNGPGWNPSEPIQPVPMVYLVRLMIVCGRISNVLNGRRGRARTLVAADEPLAAQLAELQARLVEFYASLPDAMRWSADNFKYQQARGHGGTFLTLHLWANAVLALVYHPDLLKSPSGVETPLNRSMARNVKLALASSRQICECMVFADLVSASSYTSSPFVVQPLYVAAMALIQELRAAQANEASNDNPSEMFLIGMARQNFQALLKAILRIESYWAGANYVANLLEKRSGISRPKASKRTFISLPDQGLLRRFVSDRNHPHDIAPPDETTLRESIAKKSSNGPSPLWVSDLLTGYSVENMSFAPADSMDFARLMGVGTGRTPPGSTHSRPESTTGAM